MGGLQKFGFRNSNAIFPVSGSYAPFLILGLYAVTRSGVFRRDVSFFWTERRLVLHFLRYTMGDNRIAVFKSCKVEFTKTRQKLNRHG